MDLLDLGKIETSQNEVFVYTTSPATLKKDIEWILEKSRLTKCYDAKKKTLIKINANYDRNYPGCNTSTWFLDALLTALRKLGFTDLTAVEGDLKLQPAKRTIRVIGVKEVLEKHNIPFLPLEGCPRGKDELPFLIHEAQIINVPVIHTHTFAVISCASKNLFGLFPVNREKYHNELSKKLLELVQSVNPCFTIVDGTVGQEGSSMRMGDPKRLDLILSGWNPLAIDVVVAKIMGFSMAAVPLLRLAKEKRLLPKSITVTGDYNWENLPIYYFKYKKPILSRLDLWLRRNVVTKVFFEYKSFLDQLAQRTRRTYLSIKFHYKKKKLYSGPWMLYSQQSSLHQGLTRNKAESSKVYRFTRTIEPYDKSYFQRRYKSKLKEKLRRRVYASELSLLGTQGKLLDVGCGKGVLAQICLKDNWEYIGIDLSLFAISQASQNGFQVICADALHSPFQEASFDAIICNNIIEHLNNFQSNVLFHEIRRMLKREGIVVIRTPDYQLVQETFFDDPTHTTPYTSNELSRVLTNCNLHATLILTDLTHILIPFKLGKMVEPLMRRLLRKFKIGNIICLAKKVHMSSKKSKTGEF